MLSKEERMQRKIEKLQLKQEKIQEKLQKKYKNYQERDDKEQQIWMRQRVKDDNEQIQVQDDANFVIDTKLSKKDKKILKNQQKELNKREFWQKDRAPHRDYFNYADTSFESSFEPKTQSNTQPKIQEKPVNEQKTEFQHYENLQKAEQPVFKQEINREPEPIFIQKETKIVEKEPKIVEKTEKNSNFVYQTISTTPEPRATIEETKAPKAPIVEQSRPVEQKKESVSPSFVYYEDVSVKQKQQPTETKKQETAFSAEKPTSNESKTSKDESEKLKQENKELKEKNARLTAVNNDLNKQNRGFHYAEILTKKEDSKKDKEIAQLKEEKEVQSAKQKQADLEEEIRQDKINDIVRQRKDLNYTIERLEDKIEDWYEISERDYLIAMDWMLTGETIKGIFFHKDWTYWMARSMVARSYAQSYQKDLQVEREKMLEKEKQLQRLCQR